MAQNVFKRPGPRIVVGVAAGLAAFALAPRLFDTGSKAVRQIKPAWDKGGVFNRATLGVLLAGQIIPVVTLATIWYVAQVAPKSP